MFKIITPQFKRIEPISVDYKPTTKAEFDELKQMSSQDLKTIGCILWEGTHWLYPHEWYNLIPEGYPVVDINGITEPFQKGITDDDMRFGALAYGFIR